MKGREHPELLINKFKNDVGKKCLSNHCYQKINKKGGGARKTAPGPNFLFTVLAVDAETGYLLLTFVIY